MERVRRRRSGTRGAAAGGSLLLALLACAGPARDGETQLTFWAFGREGEVVQELVREFERQTPGVRVKMQQIPWLRRPAGCGLQTATRHWTPARSKSALAAAFLPGGPYAKMLANRPVIARVGDLLDPADREPLVLEDPLTLPVEPFPVDVGSAGEGLLHRRRIPVDRAPLSRPIPASG